ncbi:MAG: lysyl oxidase family protein, partial [Trueperaceae bacterium]
DSPDEAGESGDAGGDGPSDDRAGTDGAPAAHRSTHEQRSAGRTPHRPDADALNAYQMALDPDGVPHDLGEVGTLNYEHRHGHLHLASFARYELWRLSATGAPDRLVAENDKVGFCLMDNLLIDEAVATRTEPWYVGCERDVQGISPGWGDRYVAELFEQDLILNGLPDGRYRLVHIADPHDLLFGADPSIAWASVDLVLEGTTVAVVETSQRTGAP